ncbi:MAG: STAS domain-containing protein [Chitinivibrionales bacterium]|nr:STAS domain-containing protein [Chitinivibrionales bacterium]
MEITTRTVGSTLIIAVDGQLTGPRSIQVNRIVEKARSDQCKKVALDMSRVSLLDSVGLGGLIYCQQVLQKVSKSFIVCAVPQHIQELLDGFGFGRILSIADAVPES